jgi:hypothetical protein
MKELFDADVPQANARTIEGMCRPLFNRTAQVTSG